MQTLQLIAVSDADLAEAQLSCRSTLEHQLKLDRTLSADVAEILIRRPDTKSPLDHALILKALQKIVEAHTY